MDLRKRYSGVDGLRAVAVCLVIGYHFFKGAVPGGFIGVDVFFVISGFVITTVLGRARRAQRLSFRIFWRNRARRILPALLLVVLTCATVASLSGLVGDPLRDQVTGALTFSSNWLSIYDGADYFQSSPPSLLTHFWSLAVEEQFYLIWPLILLLLWRVAPRLRIAALLLLSAASAALMTVLFLHGADQTRVYFGSDTHLFGLTLGAALALYVEQRPESRGTDDRGRRWWALGVLGFATVVAAAFIFHDDGRLPYLGGLFAISVATGLFILSLVSAPSVASRLESPLLRAIGRRSYGLYLWHWPVLFLTRSAWERAFGVAPSDIVLAAIAVPVAVVLAIVSYRFVEEPILRGGFREFFRMLRLRAASSARSKLVAGTLAVAVVASILCVGGVLVAPPAPSAAEVRVEKGRQAIADAAAGSPTAAPVPATTSPRLSHPSLPIPRQIGAPTDQPAPADPIPPTEPPTAPPVAAPVDRATLPITAVGDSVMLAVAPELLAAMPQIQIDAVVSRQASAAPKILQDLEAAGTLHSTVVVGLGTNGAVAPATLDAIRDAIGADRQLVVVNVYAERSWSAGVNTELAEYASTHPATTLVDWHSIVNANPGILGDDRIHPGRTGGQLYADALRAAISSLS
ncbi:N/A [soil metagenome]